MCGYTSHSRNAHTIVLLIQLFRAQRHSECRVSRRRNQDTKRLLSSLFSQVTKSDSTGHSSSIQTIQVGAGANIDQYRSRTYSIMYHICHAACQPIVVGSKHRAVDSVYIMSAKKHICNVRRAIDRRSRFGVESVDVHALKFEHVISGP